MSNDSFRVITDFHNRPRPGGLRRKWAGGGVARRLRIDLDMRPPCALPTTHFERSAITARRCTRTSRTNLSMTVGKELRHDSIDLSIVESVVGDRFDKIGGESINAVSQQNALFRGVGVG
jgi:hypothetical protein